MELRAAFAKERAAAATRENELRAELAAVREARAEEREATATTEKELRAELAAVREASARMEGELRAKLAKKECADRLEAECGCQVDNLVAALGVGRPVAEKLVSVGLLEAAAVSKAPTALLREATGSLGAARALTQAAEQHLAAIAEQAEREAAAAVAAAAAADEAEAMRLCDAFEAEGGGRLASLLTEHGLLLTAGQKFLDEQIVTKDCLIATSTNELMKFLKLGSSAAEKLKAAAAMATPEVHLRGTPARIERATPATPACVSRYRSHAASIRACTCMHWQERKT